MAPTPASNDGHPVSRLALRSMWLLRRNSDSDDECASGERDASLCEKPVSNTTLPIVIGIVVPLVIALVLILFFLRKGAKRRRREEMADPNRDLDFGIGGDVGGKPGKKGKRKSMFQEKMMGLDPRHRAQMSMDMNLTSPYLLPPTLQGSKESLHSLARNINNNEDPYRPVQNYGSDVGSMRSFRQDKETGSSVYTRSTERRDTVNSRDLPPRGNSLAHRGARQPPQDHLPMPPPPVADPFGTPKSGSMTPRSDMTTDVAPRGIVPEIGTVEFPQANYGELDRDDNSTVGNNNFAPAADRSAPDSLSQFPSPPASQTKSPALPEFDSVGLGLNEFNFGTTSPSPPAPPPIKSLPASPRPPEKPAALPTIVPDDTHAYNDHESNYQDYEYEGRGRSPQRRSMDGNYRDSQVLGVPQQDSKRLSVGMRPLPPDEVMEFEDPEERANRIRSFYKEYFDDSVRPDQQPPMPQYDASAYYEDYDAGYAGNSHHNNDAFYDPKSNAFVMPYAQPVTRRAMTPPPSGSRQRGPPPLRGMHGSMGGMSMPGGRRPPPRSGSAMSSNWGQPRPGSSVSNRTQQQRQARPKGPPPAALTTLPTPSKLRDDSVALLGAIDFAPPVTYEERARGRSQSPMGERRPYKPKVPVASPLISSYEEMPAIPSPHLLRKSSTFTGLDFAPPRKFANEDSMSDAGSIRSNRSGMSAAQAYAIRNGAGRVSRLPEDMVFTTAKLEQTLKPTWNMHNNS